MSHEPQHKHAILFQILVHKSGRHLLVLVPLDLIQKTEVLLDIPVPVDSECTAQGPGQETEAEHGGHKDHPEPDEKIDLFVEEVNGQHTLYSVTLDISKPAHFEITHGNAGEAWRLGPVLSIGQRFDDVDAVEVVVGSQEDIEGKELANDVADVDDLTEKVEDDQVVTKTPATHQTAGSGEAVLDAHCTACPVVLLTRQVPGNKP